MAKVARGRIAGLYGMESQTAQELHVWADDFELRALHSDPADELRWLRRRAIKLRNLAEQKERAREHKANQRKSPGNAGGRPNRPSCPAYTASFTCQLRSHGDRQT